MIHLITVVGKSAKDFYLNQQCISDFKSLMRTVTSGRVMIISTKFRSDLFYVSQKVKNDSILKLWAFYANTNLSSLNMKDFITSTGDENSLSMYFQSMNTLSVNWHHYNVYKKVFNDTFRSDHQNPVAKTVAQCDQHLIEHPSITRTALTSSNNNTNSKLLKDTYALAMRIISNQTLSN